MGGGVNIVKASFDVEEKSGEPGSGPLQGSEFVCQDEPGVQGAKAWEGAALVGVEHASEAGNSGEPNGHDLRQDL